MEEDTCLQVRAMALSALPESTPGNEPRIAEPQQWELRWAAALL